MLRLMLGAICGIVLPVIAGAQGADFLARQDLADRLAAMSDPLRRDSLARDAAALMTDLGLTLTTPVIPHPPDSAFTPGTGAVVEMVDIRLLLTRIAVQAGAQDHAGLIRAQGDREHDVILLRGGLTRLDELTALAQGTLAAPFMTQTDAGLVLTRPLAIWEDSGLVLSAGDTLILDRPSGSFVANLGRLVVRGGTIRGNSEPNSIESDFRPFVLTAGQGSFAALDARFSRLGNTASAIFGGVAVVNSGLVKTPLPSTIRDSSFSDVGSVALVGTSGSMVAGNRFSESSGTAVLVSGGIDAVVAGNRFQDRTGTRAIRVTSQSFDVLVSGNLLSQGPGIGILIDQGSGRVTLSGNVILGSKNTGIAVRAADCVIVTGNLVALSAGSGISITDSQDASLGANGILFNLGSGVLVRDQTGSAVVRLTANLLAGNREGLRGATAGRLDLTGNQMDGQLPRIFAGDLAPLTVDWLRHRHDPAPDPRPAADLARCRGGGNG